MIKKATFIDFDDSFSYNVVQELDEMGLDVTVVNWKDFEDLPSEGLLVLGPGPGHPDDYQRIYPLVKEWLQKKKAFFGVCLGHQIFWRILGEDVSRSKLPLHGQKVALNLDQDWASWLKLENQVVEVQRYNSLTVFSFAQMRNPIYKSFIQDDEIMMTRGEQVVTYQFHPESMGTSFRKSFFGPLLRDLVY